MVASQERIDEVVRYSYKFSIEEAARHFGLKPASIERYRRDWLRPGTAKILIFDIETAPLTAHVWQNNVYNANIRYDQVITDWFMLSWSAKWLNDSKVMGEVLTSKEAKDRDDKRITNILWQLFNEADIVVAHNAFKFDVPNVSTRFLVHKMKPPKPYRVFDTLKVARKQFGFTHNNLDALACALGLENKLETEFALWKRCVTGDSGALGYMLDYNKQDVLLLEEVYLIIRGWTNSHPNINKYQDTVKCCSHCGSENIVSNGHYYTQANRYESFQCRDCGGFSRVSGKQLLPTAR